MNEKRQYHRYLLQTDIEAESVNSKKKRALVTKDISHGGICITTKESPLSTGDTHIINFRLPGNEKPIKAMAEVVWSRENSGVFDNGLMFTRISRQARDLIDEFSIGSVEEK